MTITSAPPATEDQIRAAESTLGFPLPSQYKEFLRMNNGGRPSKSWFDEMVGVSDFMDVGVHGDSDLVANYDVYRDRIPEGLLL